MKLASTMSSTPVIMMAAGLSIIALLFAFSPAGLRDGFDILNPALSDYTWQTVKLDTQGRIVRVGSNPFAILALISLVAASVVCIGFSAWRLIGGRGDSGAAGFGRAPTGAAAAAAAKNDVMLRKFESAGLKLESELASVLMLLQGQLGSSDRYGMVLEDANKQLPSATSVEQVERIVQLLVTENSHVRTEVANLKQGLENSQSQIESLRLNLREAEEQSLIDSLTSLKNRRWFDRDAPKVVANAQKAGSPFSLVMADIDNFKKLNDTFGHQIGDEVLRRFAELLQKNIKGRDSAIRYGGEEFTLILPDTSITGARQLTENIRRHLESKRWLDQKSGRSLGVVTASFGIAELRRDESLDSLVRRADEMLYDAKSTGKNRVTCDV